MKTWNVKKFSKLAKVTIRALHYYDKIGLLEPTYRLPNGYRGYTKNDLNKIRKITSLKFCGFRLSHIQLLLECDNNDAINLFTTQLQLLQEQFSHIKYAQLVLMEQVIKDILVNKELNWQAMIQFIQEYTNKKESKSELNEPLFTPEYLATKVHPSDDTQNL